MEDTKQNNITVLDTIQISKLKTQYITMSLTGQDLQRTLNDLEGTITNLDNGLSEKQDNIVSSDDLTYYCFKDNTNRTK